MAKRNIEHEREADGAEDVILHMGHEELILRRRYELLSLANDFLIGLWFLIGSVAFFYPAWEDAGIWLFVLGSAQLLARPAIRLVHRVSVRRITDSNWDL